MFKSERRKYNRLPVKFAISCRKVGSTAQKSHKGSTVNVSPGGLYFEIPAGIFKPGDLLKVEISIPPTTGILESGGRIAALAGVLRTHNIYDTKTKTSSPTGRYGIASQFSQPPKLCT